MKMTSEGECADMFGRLMPQGNHYVPGPDSCTLCVCVSGQPKWCKAVLCSPPQDCKSFRVGHTCCEFICLDDTLSKQPENSYDFGLRLIAGAVSTILLLSVLLYIVHRLRRRKLHGRQNMQQSDDQRSLASIGYIEGSMAYIGNGCDDGQVNYPVWKPPGNYFPRGEAPPPYDEVVAQVRAESVNRALMDHGASFHRSFSVNHTSNLESLMRSEERGSRIERQHLPGSSAIYTHHPVHSAPQPPSHRNINNTEQQMTAKILDDNSNLTLRTHHSILTTGGNNNYAGSMKITNSLGTIATSHEDTANSADIPSRTMPPGYPALYSNITHSTASTGHRTIPRTSSATEDEMAESGGPTRETEETRRPSEKTLGKLMMLFGKLQADEASTTLPLTVDKPSCGCSYACEPPPLHDDQDDYHSECENCKSATGSRYYMGECGDGGEEEDEGTVTLQRRPVRPTVLAATPASFTLPPNTKKHRHANSTMSNRENWFISIPGSSSSEED